MSTPEEKIIPIVSNEERQYNEAHNMVMRTIVDRSDCALAYSNLAIAAAIMHLAKAVDSIAAEYPGIGYLIADKIDNIGNALIEAAHTPQRQS